MRRMALVWPILIGGYLRLWHLPQQILVDDEWHMVHKLRAGTSFAGLVADFGTTDHSIGLSVCDWLLMQLTAVDELWLRMPSVVAGMLLIGLFPAMMQRHLGRGASTILAWLLAVSPLLCFFTRLARPYAITTLLVCVAATSFHTWVLSGGNRRAAWTYALSAGAVAVFHLPALPAALAPLGLLLLVRGYPPARATVSGRQAARLALATFTIIVALLAAPLVFSGTHVLARLNVDRLSVATVPGMVELLVGTSRWPAVLLALSAGVVGAAALWRRSPLLTLYLALVTGWQVAAVAASGAAAISVPVVAARYIAVVLPLLLVFPATALDALVAGWRRPGIAASLAGALAAGALWIVGPLPWIYQWPNAFTNHASYQADYRPGRYFERFRPSRLSAFYGDVLAALPAGSVTVVEAPWYYYFHSLAYLQRVHRQHVVIGFASGDSPVPRIGELRPNDPGIQLRNAVDLGDRDGMRARHVGFVVLHRDPRSEIRWPTGVSDAAIDMHAWIERYRTVFGAPVFEDEQLVAFAVDG
jgi:hypothetical protein